MGTLTVKSSSLSRTADYNDENSGIVMNINYQLDETTMRMKRIDGSIYKSPSQTYAGNFSGNEQNGTIDYSISGVKLADMPSVYAAMADIESQINANQEEAES